MVLRLKFKRKVKHDHIYNGKYKITKQQLSGNKGSNQVHLLKNAKWKLVPTNMITWPSIHLVILAQKEYT